MSELQDKLSAILADPNAMGQIMALARSLEGGGEAPQPPPAEAPPAPAVQEPAPDLSALLSGLTGGGPDPRLLSVASRIMAEAGRNDDRRTALLQALRPFVKEERYRKLDKAVQIARLSHLIRVGLAALKGGEEDV